MQLPTYQFIGLAYTNCEQGIPFYELNNLTEQCALFPASRKVIVTCHLMPCALTANLEQQGIAFEMNVHLCVTLEKLVYAMHTITPD